VILLVIADLAGAFNGSGKGSATPGSGVSPSPGASTSAVPTSTPATATSAAASPAGTTTTTSVAPTTPSSPVHRLVVAEAKWTLPNTLSRMVVLPVPKGLEMIGGLLDGDTSSSLVRLISLPSGTAALAGRLATGVHDAAGGSYKGRLYVFGGGGAAEVATVQRLSIGHVAAKVGTLPAARSDLVEAQAGGKVVLLGGYDGTNALADVLVSTDGKTFSVLTQLPVPVRYPAPVVRGNAIYLYGGDVNGKPSDVIQKIDVGAATATIVGHLPEPLSHEAAFVFGSTVWLAGGTDPAGTSAKLFRADDAVAFVRDGVLPSARSDAGAAMLGGVGYLLGGENGSRLKSVLTLRPG
jgi:hypothetical protein